MKIALVTIHNANNYGAIFQAYATQCVLSGYGDVEIINYNNRHVSRSFDLIRLELSFHGVLGTVKDVFRYLPRRRVIRKFEKFVSSNIKQTDVYERCDLKQGSADLYDVYVAGSDQIWNPDCVSENKSIDDIYFLEFVQSGAKKISYASSIGSYKYSSSEETLIKKYLGTFSGVSVREADSKVYIQELLGRNVRHVLDPTLLLDKTDWLRVAGIDQVVEPNEKYILLYSIPKSPLVNKMVEVVSKSLKIRVVAIDQGLFSGAKVDKQVRDAGPEEFLKLFARAEFVITDSFHGVCFALNFERSFVVTTVKKHANRIESLLSLVGLQERLCENEEDLKKLEYQVDFSRSCQKLKIAREKSLEYLNRELR